MVSASNTQINKLAFTNKKPTAVTTPFVKNIKKQLCEYFDTKRKRFDIMFEDEGTKFQKAVWKAARSIPYGKTVTYMKIAEMIGKPRAYRACGNALNKNPLMILTPCHRVIASNGIGGFGHGLRTKIRLLKLECSETSSNPPQIF